MINEKTPIGTQLRLMRVATCTTLKKVSNATGISVSFLSEIERSKEPPTHQLVNKIADYIDSCGYKADRNLLAIATDISRNKIDLSKLADQHKLFLVKLSKMSISVEDMKEIMGFLEK